MFCAAPFGGNTDTQNSLSGLNGKDIVKASAGSSIVNKTTTNGSTVNDTTKNTTKTVKVVVDSVKMDKKDYKEMVKSIDK